jgi:prepilin-type N-terminal cleavage/methylation domain-containing protein
MRKLFMQRGAGFTLLELLTVMAIMSIMAAFLIVASSRARARAKKHATLRNIKELENALEAYLIDWREYPTEAPGAPYAGAGDAFYENAANVQSINSALVAQLVTKRRGGPYLSESECLLDTDSDGVADLFVDAFKTSTTEGAPLCYKRPENPNSAVTVQNDPAPDVFSAGLDGDYSTWDDNLKNYE